MTLREVASQLFDLSVAGYINGEKFTKSQFSDALSHWMLTGNSYIGEIALPDGRWHFEVSRFSGKASGCDYYIPETREQDKRLSGKLMARSR